MTKIGKERVTHSVVSIAGFCWLLYYLFVHVEKIDKEVLRSSSYYWFPLLVFFAVGFLFFSSRKRNKKFDKPGCVAFPFIRQL